MVQKLKNYAQGFAISTWLLFVDISILIIGWFFAFIVGGPTAQIIGFFLLGFGLVSGVMLMIGVLND